MSYTVYKAMASDDVVLYYGQTGRPFDERKIEHIRSATRLSGFQCKDLILGLAIRQNNLSFEIVEEGLTKIEATKMERLLIHEHNPLGNEAHKRK